MTILLWLIPVSLILGFGGLLAFFWALKDGQFDDTKGDAERLLFPDFDDHPHP